MHWRKSIHVHATHARTVCVSGLYTHTYEYARVCDVEFYMKYIWREIITVINICRLKISRENDCDGNDDYNIIMKMMMIAIIVTMKVIMIIIVRTARMVIIMM